MNTKLKPFRRERREAKDLLRQLEAGDDAAIARLRAHREDPSISLMQAQHVIAREHGFVSWRAMMDSVSA